MSFDAQTKEDALSQYTRLSNSHDPNDKLLALGGLVRFLRDADRSFLLRCAQVTDYQFLEKLMRSGTPVVSEGRTDVGDVKMEKDMPGDTAQLSQLGCTVIGVFATLDQMKGQDEIVQRIPTLFALLQRQYEKPCLLGKTDERSQEDGQDTVATLQTLATTQKGADMILRTVLKSLVDGTKILDDNTLSLIGTALDHIPASPLTLRILKLVSQQFATTKNQQLATILLTFFISQFARSPPPPKDIHTPLYLGLRTLMLSNIDESARTNTLILLSLLLSHLGPDFLFSPSPNIGIKPKPFILLTIRIASVGVQTGYSHLTPQTKDLEKQRLVACIDILHVTVAWLLSCADDAPRIGEDVLTPEETLLLQGSMSAAFSQVSGFLRSRYDQLKLVLVEDGAVEGDDSIEPLVRSAIKFIGGWLGEGGGINDAETENLGLLEPLLAVCQNGDVQATTWAMRGIKGILQYTVDGSTELLSHKHDLVKLLAAVSSTLESRETPREEMLMIREISAVFRIMVEEQPSLLTEKEIRQFPTTIIDSLSSERVDENTWDARTDGALLGLEILLKVAQTEGTFDRRVLQKWRATVRLLVRVQQSQDMGQDLEFLSSALEKMAL